MKKGLKNSLIISIASLATASVTILFMPLADRMMDDEKAWFAYVLAAVFWIGTVAGYISFVRLNGRCKSILSKKEEKTKEKTKGSRIQRMPIATNLYGAAANVICLLAILIYLISQVVLQGYEAWGYGSIFGLVLGIHMSIVCNSRSFTYTMNLKDRRVKEHEE